MRYLEQVQRLHVAAGRPNSSYLSREMGKRLPRREDAPPAPTIGGWLAGRIARDVKTQLRFLALLEQLARQRKGLDYVPPTQGDWIRMMEARRKENAESPATDAASPAPAPTITCLEWVEFVAASRAWQLVAPGAQEERAEVLREQAEEVARLLVDIHDEQQDAIADDPWRDPDLVRRMVHWSDKLLDRLEGTTLFAAEAALIALLPVLYLTHRAYSAAALAHVDPTKLEEAEGGSHREAHNRVLRNHKRLVRQAQRGDDLPDRQDGRTEIGWWLFHQWAKAQERLQDLLRDLGQVGSDIAGVLDRGLLSRLLSYAHAVPHRLGGRAGERDDDLFRLDFGGRGGQEVREHFVGSLFAVVHAMAIEVTDLPTVVAKHIGIPDSLDSKRLLTTLADAGWTLASGDAIRLSATCDHPAAVAALTEHVGHVDALLRAVRRSRSADGIQALPVYATAEEVREADDTGTPRRAGEVIRFRLDEERIQELLMGENLYRDRSLAIRELYQNALDACRFRRAWQHKREGEDTFQGKITFEQGYDEKEKRHFLECRDNGIGMDETMLAEVFSQAGVRLADHSRYEEEARRWEGHGITVHPNSRFGIGVLSYFMLADEIRVTTCAYDSAAGRPEQLTVLITGPGHYFRVRRTGEHGPTGTTVRLYLRDAEKAPSCVRELRRLLGIAEFSTEATRNEGQERAPWRPGVLETRESSASGQADGVVAHGRTVPWSADGEGGNGQVVWCEHGGGILVDGIFIEPRVRRGVLASGPVESGRLRGAVVNLTGASSPKDLSVDRSEILDEDVDRQVERLIRAALPTLFATDPPLLTPEWLADVAAQSPRLADIVTEAAGAAGVDLDVHGHRAPVATVGFFPPDVSVVHRTRLSDLQPVSIRTVRSVPDDATLLWRLLAHRPNTELTALTSLVPELSEVRDVLPARPSDVLMRTEGRPDPGDRAWIVPGSKWSRVPPGHVASTALACGVTYDEALTRMELLRMPAPERPSGPVTVDATTVALLDHNLHGVARNYSAVDWLRLDEPVTPGHFLKAHLTLNIGIGEAVDRMRALGFAPAVATMPTGTPEDWVVRLLSKSLGGGPVWLDPAQPVRVGHVVSAMRKFDRSLPEVVAALRAYGLTPDLGLTDEWSAGELLRTSTEWGWEDSTIRRLDVSVPVPPGLLAHASWSSGVPLSDIARRVEEWGFAAGILPDAVAEPDLDILDFRDGIHATPAAGEEIPIWLVVGKAVESGLSPKAVAARLREYGLRPQEGGLPDDWYPSDRIILDQVYYALPAGEDDLVARTLPMLAILQATEDARVSPQEVIDCLHRYGLRTSHATAPATARRDDRELVAYRSSGSRFLDWSRPVPPHHLVTVPPAVLMEREDVIRRLAEYGLDVPTHALDSLTDDDVRLCGETFGRQRTDLPLALNDPIDDFLTIVRLADLPLADLLPSLTRLGVDLPRVAEAVRTALPRVPGLVMTPREP
ncbi:wHTH domain-containing protein [Streptomyces sp. NPDC001975]